MTTTNRTRTIEWQDPMTIARASQSLSGLAFLSAIVEGKIPQPPIGQTLDFALVGVGEGTARFRGVPGEYHYNPIGVVHGGFAATLLDSAMGCAVMSTLDEKTGYTTSDLSIRLLRAITAETGPVMAEARLIHRGRRVATAEGSLRDEAGRLLAHGTTSCILLLRE